MLRGRKEEEERGRRWEGWDAEMEGRSPGEPSASDHSAAHSPPFSVYLCLFPLPTSPPPTTHSRQALNVSVIDTLAMET